MRAAPVRLQEASASPVSETEPLQVACAPDIFPFSASKKDLNALDAEAPTSEG